MNTYVIVGLFLFLASLLGAPIFSQPVLDATSKRTVRIAAVKANTLPSPRYDVSSDITPQRKVGPDKWLELRAGFASAKPWTDEITVRMFIVMAATANADLPEGAKPDFNVLSGTVVYEDIPRGSSHVATMYMTPAKLARYGRPVAYRVEMTSGGVPMDYKMEAKDARFETVKWWTAEGRECLVNKAQTPFSAIDFDGYNDIRVDAIR